MRNLSLALVGLLVETEFRLQTEVCAVWIEF
jgi:hypothetical protein